MCYTTFEAIRALAQILSRLSSESQFLTRNKSTQNVRHKKWRQVFCIHPITDSVQNFESSINLLLNLTLFELYLSDNQHRWHQIIILYRTKKTFLILAWVLEIQNNPCYITSMSLSQCSIFRYSFRWNLFLLWFHLLFSPALLVWADYLDLRGELNREHSNIH